MCQWRLSHTFCSCAAALNSSEMSRMLLSCQRVKCMVESTWRKAFPFVFLVALVYSELFYGSRWAALEQLLFFHRKHCHALVAG